MPFQHVTQIDDKSARHGFHMLPLALCVDLQLGICICCQNSQHTIVCVCTSTIYTLHRLVTVNIYLYDLLYSDEHTP